MMRITRSIIGAAIATALCLLSAAPVFAECVGQSNRWPAFTEVAPSAQRIVIGTVTKGIDQFRPGRYHVAYLLRVDDTLRGSAPAVMEIRGLRSGMPLKGSEACRDAAYLAAKDGDVIAIAFNGRVPGVANPVTTAAWIKGKPFGFATLGAQRLTLAEVRRAAGLPDTSTTRSDPAPHSDATNAWLGLMGLVLGGVAVLAISRRRSEVAPELVRRT